MKIIKTMKEIKIELNDKEGEQVGTIKVETNNHDDEVLSFRSHKNGYEWFLKYFHQRRTPGTAST